MPPNFFFDIDASPSFDHILFEEPTEAEEGLHLEYAEYLMFPYATMPSLPTPLDVQLESPIPGEAAYSDFKDHGT